MSLTDGYKKQLAWRDWDTVLDALPSLAAATVLDLGCGVGDVTELLSRRGAHVVGVDMNVELLTAARARRLPRAEFRSADLWTLPPPEDLAGAADGLWCGFTVAYFTDPAPVVSTWMEHLRPGGWIALIEIDDLFGHEPVTDRTRSLLSTYADDALTAGRYDFRMGRRLRPLLEECGCKVEREFDLTDQVLSFDGPATPDVLEGWRTRLDGMKLLREHCGPEFEWVRADFLGCLIRADHRSFARVQSCIATK